MNAVVAILALAFMISLGVWLLEYFIFHGALLGGVQLDDGTGYGISGLIVLGIAIALVVARYTQLTAGFVRQKRQSRKPGLP